VRLIAAAAIAVLAGASCPSKPNANASEFVNAQFNAEVVCEPSFLAKAEPVFLFAQNQARIQIAIDAFNRDLNDPNVTFSQKDYDDCLHAADADDCAVVNDNGGSCGNVFVGKLAENAKCASGVECQPDLDCFQNAGACGTCKAIAQEGTDCSDRVCVAGDFCSQDHQICEPKPDPTTFTAGDQCTPVAGCGGILSGLQCVANHCAEITVVTDGQTCDASSTSVKYCQDSSTTHSCEASVCAKRPVAGEACNAEGACDARVAACKNNTCDASAGKAGDACTNGNGCQLGFACKSNVCTALENAPTPPKCN
jgi:hypothetical protein